jgi:hypothetical protein
VPTATPTTISGVSLITPLVTREGAPAPEVFEIVLSAAGIDFRRTERPHARLSWDRVSEWEIEEREGDVLLTLQQGDAATPLLIPGWSATDLAAMLRQLTEPPAQAKAAATPVRAKNPVRAKKPAETIAGDDPGAQTPDAARSGVADLLGAAPGAEAETEEEPAARDTSRRARRHVSWKAVLAVALLGVLATAVAIVLLQSAGVINWSFLGPNV